MTTLSLAKANTIIEATLAKGAEMGIKPLSAAVLDAGGHLVAFQRSDRSSFMRFEIAAGKAYGALALGVGSRWLHNQAETRPHFLEGLSNVSGGKIVAVPGGVLIKAGGEIVGAVGVIIGGAFGGIVKSLTDDIIMPIVGAIFGGFDFTNYFIPLASGVDATTLDAAREQGAYRREHMYDSYENRSSADRCIMGFNAGPPMVSATYNNNVMIFQSPGYVTILNEMVHNARIIPIGDTASPPFPQYSGVSRGHWAGETLVIETTQFRGGSSGLTSPNMHLIERLTRLDPDTVAYEYTVTDPTVYTAPYTVMMPLRRTDGPIFEYACHEGNSGMAGIMAGARALEKAEAEATTAGSR